VPARSLAVAATCLTLIQTTPARAQSDSLATIAREQYRLALQAVRAGSLAEARDLMVAAHQAWPTQVAYLASAARLSARLGDTAGTARWLGAIADLGLTTALDADSGLTAMAEAPALREVVGKIRRNGEPLWQGRPIQTDASVDFYPEGVDFDPKANEWLLAGVRKRTVVRVGRDGRTKAFLHASVPRLDAVLGIRVDAARDRVWITTRVLPVMEDYRPGQPNRARVAVLDRVTGTLLAMADAPDDGAPHFFGDLVVHSSGDVYLTDSESPVLYRATLTSERLTIEEVARDRLFRSLQGLAFDDAGDVLYLADYSHGLLSLDLGSREVRSLAPPPGTTLLGIDGMVWRNRALIAVQNGVAPARIVRIRLSRSAIERVEVVDRDPARADEPTIGTMTQDQFVYVANSQWEKYDEEGRLKPGARLTAPILIAVPLRW
jgi:hypothetical protein